MKYIIYIYIYIYYTLESSHDIDTDIAISNDKTNYVSELRTTHLVKQDDVGMTVVAGADIDITTNGNAEDITKIYDSVNKSRLGIAGKLKGIARIINDSLDNYEFNVVTDDNSTNETNDDLLL